MEELILGLLAVLFALMIIFYATWLLFHRLLSGDSPKKSFWKWLKNIAEAILGL